MTIFGIGPVELVIIVVIALVVVGPERLPDMMYQLGQGISKAKNMILTLRNQAREELGEDYETFETMTRQIRELDPRRQIQDLSRALLDDPTAVKKIDLPPGPAIAPTPAADVAAMARAALDLDLLDQPLSQSLDASPEEPPASREEAAPNG